LTFCLTFGHLGGLGNICGRSKTGVSLGKCNCMPARTIEQVLSERTDQLMAIDGVEGTAIGLYRGKPCTKIFTSVEAQELRGRIPSVVEGYPVIIKKTGKFCALDEQ